MLEDDDDDDDDGVPPPTVPPPLPPPESRPPTDAAENSSLPLLPAVPFEIQAVAPIIIAPVRPKLAMPKQAEKKTMSKRDRDLLKIGRDIMASAHP